MDIQFLSSSQIKSHGAGVHRSDRSQQIKSHGAGVHRSDRSQQIKSHGAGVHRSDRPQQIKSHGAGVHRSDRSQQIKSHGAGVHRSDRSQQIKSHGAGVHRSDRSQQSLPAKPFPIIEEVLPKLNDAIMFSLVDAKYGFLQVKLTNESSYLTIFWTPFGKHRWLRMTFDFTSSPEEFQRRLQLALEGLDGNFIVADDILIIGRG